MNYYSKDNSFGYDREGRFVVCGNDILVTAVRNNIEDETCCFDVKFCLADIVKKGTMTFENLKNELNRIGYSISYDNEKNIKAYLQQQIDDLKSIQVYTNIGWYRSKSKIAFKGIKLKHPDNEAAEYYGNLDIKPRGKLQCFKRDLEKYIIGKIPLETAVIIGLSACVVGYIRLFTSVSNIVCNIHGKTTTGKTTVAKLAISMGGNPYCGDGKNSLAGTCFTTANALCGQLRGNTGYPVLFDELGSLSKNADVNQMLYCLAEGEDKKRLNKSGSIKLLEKWSTTIIFTSEYPMLDDDVQSGLNVRILNFADVKWTEDAKQARIVELFSEQYAGLGIDVLSESMIGSSADIFNDYLEAVKEIKAKINVDDSLKDRSAKPIAIMKLTAELASKAFGVNFSTDDIVSFVIKAVEADKPIPSWQKMYDEVLQNIEKDIRVFRDKSVWDDKNSEDLSSGISSPCYGYIAYDDSKSGTRNPNFCIVTEMLLKSWCAKYKDFNSNLREWCDRGLLEKKKSDRYIRKERIRKQGAVINCYKIIIRSYEIDSFAKDGDTNDDIIRALMSIRKLESIVSKEFCNLEANKQLDIITGYLSRHIEKDVMLGRIDWSVFEKSDAIESEDIFDCFDAPPVKDLIYDYITKYENSNKSEDEGGDLT